jgi:hypothetical protein
MVKWRVEGGCWHLSDDLLSERGRARDAALDGVIVPVIAGSVFFLGCGQRSDGEGVPS